MARLSKNFLPVVYQYTNSSPELWTCITPCSSVVYACSYVLVPTSFVIRRSQVAERNDWSGPVVRCVAAHVRRCTRRPSRGVGLGRPIHPASRNLLRQHTGETSVYCDPNCAEAFVHRSRQPAKLRSWWNPTRGWTTRVDKARGSELAKGVSRWGTEARHGRGRKSFRESFSWLRPLPMAKHKGSFVLGWVGQYQPCPDAQPPRWTNR